MWRRGFIINLLLVSANALLLAGIINVWWGEGTDPERHLPRRGLTVPQAPPLRDQHPLNTYKVVADKTLFSSTRTGQLDKLPVCQTNNSLKDSHLLGTIIIGQNRAALIGQGGPKSRQQVQVVHLGEDWNGFKVAEISPEEVVFVGKDCTQTLAFPSPEEKP
jgi:hypothetical protein